jgi:hypothetical protein
MTTLSVVAILATEGRVAQRAGHEAVIPGVEVGGCNPQELIIGHGCPLLGVCASRLDLVW